MSLNQSHSVRSRALLCAAGLWLVGVVLCAVGVISAAHPFKSDASHGGQAHHGERGHGDDDHHGPSENCCEDIRAFPVSQFQSFVVVAPPSAAVPDFLALGELSPLAAVQQSHAVGSAQSRAPPRARGFVEIFLRKSIPGRAPPSVV